MDMRKLLVFLGVLLAYSGYSQGFRIKDYYVEALVKQDASVEVLEIIRVEFSEQKHGIQRSLPFKYDNTYTENEGELAYRPYSGAEYELMYSNLEVKGHPFEIIQKQKDINVRIGSADAYVMGNQVYQISYTVSKAINHFSDHDEFYWNLIGTEWNTPIDAARFKVKFEAPNPKGSEAKIWSGQKYSKNYENTPFKATSTSVEGKSTDVLPAYNGITIGVSFPKGYFKNEPPMAAFYAKNYFVNSLKQKVFLAKDFNAKLQEEIDIVSLKKEPLYYTRYLRATFDERNKQNFELKALSVQSSMPKASLPDSLSLPESFGLQSYGTWLLNKGFAASAKVSAQYESDLFCQRDFSGGFQLILPITTDMSEPVNYYELELSTEVDIDWSGTVAELVCPKAVFGGKIEIENVKGKIIVKVWDIPAAESFLIINNIPGTGFVGIEKLYRPFSSSSYYYGYYNAEYELKDNGVISSSQDFWIEFSPGAGALALQPLGSWGVIGSFGRVWNEISRPTTHENYPDFAYFGNISKPLVLSYKYADFEGVFDEKSTRAVMDSGSVPPPDYLFWSSSVREPRSGSYVEVPDHLGLWFYERKSPGPSRVSFETYGFVKTEEGFHYISYPLMPALVAPIERGYIKLKLPANAKIDFQKSKLYFCSAVLGDIANNYIVKELLLNDLIKNNEIVLPVNKSNTFVGDWIQLYLVVEESSIALADSGLDFDLFLENNPYLVNAFWMLLFTLLLLTVLWFLLGRDAKPKSSETAAYPPKGVSPAEAGYLWDGKLHKKDLLACFYSWAANGLLSISDEGDDLRFTRLGTISKNANVYEQTLFNHLFTGKEVGKSVTGASLSEKFYIYYNKAYREFMDQAVRSRLFMPGSIGFGYFLIGISWIFIVIGIIGTGILSPFFYSHWTAEVPIFLASICCGVLGLIFGKLMPKTVGLGNKRFKELLMFRNFVNKATPAEIQGVLASDPAYYEKTFPFVLVMGLSDKWTQKFDALLEKPLSYYTSKNQESPSKIMRKMLINMNNVNSYATKTPAPKYSGGGGGGSSYSSGSSYRSSGGGGSSYSGGGGYSGGGFGGGGGSSW